MSSGLVTEWGWAGPEVNMLKCGGGRWREISTLNVSEVSVRGTLTVIFDGCMHREILFCLHTINIF